MDVKETDLSELIDRVKSSMDEIKLSSELDTIASTSFDFGTGYQNMYGGDIPALTATTISPITITSGGTGAAGSMLGGVTGSQGYVYTTNTTGMPLGNITLGNTGPWINNGMAVNQGGTMELHGDKADVKINGKSMVAWMQAMEERLNWMQPNTELEKEWDDLRKLGNRYRRLEAKCREKAEMWKKLKSMPKPNINI